jgi:hypothetical protein
VGCAAQGAAGFPVQGREETSKVRANGRHLSAGFGGLVFCISAKKMTDKRIFQHLPVYLSVRQNVLGALPARR